MIGRSSKGGGGQGSGGLGRFSGMKDLDGLIKRFVELPEAVTEHVPAAAKAAEQELLKTIRAGTDPYGEPWLPVQTGDRKGQQAMVNASKALTTTTVGNKIFFKLKAPEARHHRGWVKGGVKRPVIPEKGQRLPAKMREAIFDVVREAFSDEIRGSKG
jgi:hypothetical protein